MDKQSNMPQNILHYYIIKRIFLFLDEWLYYFALYKLYKNKYYKINIIVFIYGLLCIYTSYSNIDKIEYEMFKEKQSLFLIDTPMYNHFKKLINDFIMFNYFTKQKLIKLESNESK